MDETEIDIRGILGLLRRRLRLIVTFVVIVGLAGIATVVLTPLFTASTLILVDTSRKNLLDPDMQGASAASDNARVDSEVEILRSDTVFLDVIASLGLVSDPEFGVSLSLRDRVLAFLHLGDGQLPSGEVALQSVLGKLKSATTVQRRGLTYLISVQVRSEDPVRAARLANAIAEAYIEDQLRSKIEGVLAAGQILQARVEQARANIFDVEQRLDAFIAGNPGQPVDITGPDQAADGARRQMRPDLLASGLPLDVLTGLSELQQAADLARSQYQTLLARSGELEMQAELQLSDSRIVSRAMPPAEASFPDTQLILLLAGMGGLGLGFGLAFVYENFVGGINSDAQLATVTRRPALGAVPLRKLPADVFSASQFMVDAPLSRYAESIRRLRTEIDQHLPDTRDGGKGRLIMVSSSVADEGKTTLALSLARAYAASGKTTLVIDCDLRDPSIHKHLNFEPDIGLLEYLAEGAEARSLASMIVRDGETGLSVLVGSRRSDIPTDQLVAGVAFERLIEAAANNFDMVVLDTPPILSVVDGLHLARYADAILFVVKWSSTAQTEVRGALDRLTAGRWAGPPILPVLNQQAGAYRGKDDSYYSG